MAIQIQGNGGTVAEVGANFRGVVSQSKPLEYGALGHYSWGGLTGILPAALAANSEIFQFKWTPAATANLCVVRYVIISAAVTTTFFAAGVPVQVGLYKASAWTVAGAGGTAVTPAALLKRRGTMASTSLAAGDMRIATTAALGAGTKTLETESISSVLTAGPTASPGNIFAPGTVLLNAEVSNGEHPIVLAAGEGLSITSIAVPATGTWQVSVRIGWSETTAY